MARWVKVPTAGAEHGTDPRTHVTERQNRLQHVILKPHVHSVAGDNPHIVTCAYNTNEQKITKFLKSKRINTVYRKLESNLLPWRGKMVGWWQSVVGNLPEALPGDTLLERPLSQLTSVISESLTVCLCTWGSLKTNEHRFRLKLESIPKQKPI